MEKFDAWAFLEGLYSEDKPVLNLDKVFDNDRPVGTSCLILSPEDLPAYWYKVWGFMTELEVMDGHTLEHAEARAFYAIVNRMRGR